MSRFSRMVVLVLVTTLVMTATPAASGASHSLKAAFEAENTLYALGGPDNYDAIETRCGEGWFPGWIFGGTGDGTVTVTKETYDATFVFDHCSRWVSFNPERATGRQVGKSEAGMMTITTADGSLELEYSGTWVLEGAIPDFTADLHLSYTVMGGTGDFEDVSRGHGRLSMTVGAVSGTGLLNGSLE